MRILTNKGALRVDVLPGDGSKWRKDLMTEEYVSLKFSLKQHVRLRKGDHIAVEGIGDYELVKTSRPRWNASKGCWDYEQKFHSEWEKWKNRKFFFNRQRGNLEKSWSLTQYIHYFLDLFVSNLSDAGLGNNWRYVIHDAALTATIKNITFDGVSLFDGITSICKTWDTEWWVEGRNIHIGKCEFGRAVRLEIGGYITDMTASESDGEYFNRLYAFGSTRNIPKNYRGEVSQTVIEGVVEKRLMLPSGTNYVDAWPNMDADDVVEGVVIFDDVYPRRVGTLYGTHTKEYTDTIENEDGTTTEQHWNAYRFKDAGLTFSKDYMIDGQELRIQFQSGLLAGCEFAVAFNPDAKEETLPQAQLFEIVRNEDYGIALPNDTLKPQDGDTYVLFGFDTSFVSNTYLPAAEQELLEKAVDCVMTRMKDDNTYTCPTDPVACAGYYDDPQRGQMFDASRIVDLDVGQSVLLVNETYFGNENRESRVRAFEKDLNNKYKCSYECGQSPKYSFFSKREEHVSTVTYNGKTFVSIGGGGSAGGSGYGEGGSNIYVLKRYDTVTPTDYNVMSSARALAEFVSRQHDDVVGGHLTLNKGFTAKDLGKLIGGALFGQFVEGLRGGKIDANGSAELQELLVRTSTLLNALRVQGVAEFDDSLFSRDFVSGFVSGSGWGIYKEQIRNALGVEETKYTGEFDNLIVRGAMRIFTLVVSQLLGENDNRIFTAMLEVHHYDAATGRVYLKTQDGKLYNPFRTGDYIMVQQYNGMPNSSNDYYITKHYELIVTAAGVGDMADGENRLDWVEFKNFVATNGGTALSLIKEGDTFCRVDNETDADRKGIIQIMTVGAATPYIDISYGLKTNPDEALKGRIGNLQGIHHPLFGQLEGFGELLQNLYAVGDFRLRRTGESVDAKIEMLKNVFATQYQKQTYELTEEENYLTNATFTENMDGWTPDPDENTKILSYTDNTPIVLNGAVVSTGYHRANVEEYDGRQMLHIQATGITQLNSLIRQPGTHREYAAPAGGASQTVNTYTEVQDTLYISIKLLPVTRGNLTIGFKYTGTTPEGKTNTLPYTSARDIAKSRDWQLLQFEGTWHGLGDFYLHYTGEMYVALLSVTDRPLDEFKRSVSTQIIQTAENVLILGNNISANGTAITNLGIELRAADQQIRLYVDTTTSDLETRLGVLIDGKEQSIKLYAEQYAKDYTDGQLNNYYTKSEIDITVSGITSSVTSITNDITRINGDLTTLGSQITAANSAISGLQSDVSGLQTYIDGAFQDGIVSQAEKVAIEKYLNTLAGTKNDLDAAYTDLISNKYLADPSSARTALVTAKSTLDTAYTSLVSTINSAIADGAATAAEITAVNNAFTTFNNAVDTFSTRVEEANEAIQDAILATANANIQQVWSDTQTQLTAVRGEIADANTATTNLRNYVDGAFEDGVLTEAEKMALRTYLNTLDTEASELQQAYTKLYANSYLTGTPKTNLNTAYTAMTTARGTLTTLINAKLAQTTVTAADITAVNNSFDAYQTAIGTFSTRVEEANEAIRAAIKTALENEIASESQRLETVAQNLANAAAIGEYYEQANNPWRSWASGTEWRHVGARWKAAAAGVAYRTYDSSGSLVDRQTVAGKVYRFIGDSDNHNVWMELTDAAASISFISQTKDHISSVVANFDANGNVTSASGIATTAYGNTIWTSKTDTDALTGRVSTCESRIDTNDTQISLRVEKNGIISAINQTAETVKILASKIKLEGYTTINNSFSVDANGVTHIGGFKVAGNGLTNSDDSGNFTNDAYIILRNDQHRSFVGIGPNVLPVYTTSRCLGRFEIEDQQDWWSSGYNIALILSAKNAAEGNFAFKGNGNGLLNGWISGYAFSKLTLTTANTIYDGFTPLKTNNVWIVRSNVSNSGIALPKLDKVCKALGISKYTDFCVPYVVMSDLGSSSFVIRGRCNIENSSGQKPWNDADLPLMTHWDGSNWNEVGMGAGDSIIFLLIYDSSRTTNIDGFPTKYTARIVNRQD